MTRRTFALLTVAAPLPASGEFTAELWAAIAPIYSKTLAHPFLKGLTDGSLPRKKFQFYLVQDALYLGAFSRALNQLASKAPRAEWAAALSRDAIESLEVERSMHTEILGSFGISPRQMSASEMAPTNYAYTNHLLVAATRGSFAEGLAAMLPCYWIYWEVGKELKKKGSPAAEYKRWIDQYSGDEYGATVRRVLAMMNAEAPGLPAASKAALTRLFTLSARYEYQFWDMAWREENWTP